MVYFSPSIEQQKQGIIGEANMWVGCRLHNE